MSGSFDSRGQLDLTSAKLVTCLGKKKSGKSKMARALFDSYPYDRVVIDWNGTDGPFPEKNPDDVVRIEGTVDDLPGTWPEHLRPHEGRRMTLYYHPDLRSPTYLEDADAVVGLCLRTERVCLLVHEMGQLAVSNRVPPSTRRLLQSNRHHGVTALMCAPRPMTMDPLVLAQSDLVYVFELPNPADRRRVADTIGWDPTAFDLEVHELQPFAYLRYDANEPKPATEDDDDLRMLAFDPLPKELVQEIDRR